MTSSRQDRIRNTTQVRVLTALAAGAIAVVQVWGPGALSVAEAIFRPRRGRRLRDVAAGRVVYGDFVDGSGVVFDDGLAVHGTARHQVELVPASRAIGTPANSAGVAPGEKVPDTSSVQDLGVVPGLSDLSAGNDSMAADDAAMAPAPAEKVPDPFFVWVEFNLHGGIRIVQRLVREAEWLGVEFVAGAIDTPDPTFEWLRPLDRWMQTCLAEAATQRVVRWLAGQPALWRKQMRRWQEQIRQGDLPMVLEEAQALIAQGHISADPLPLGDTGGLSASADQTRAGKLPVAPHPGQAWRGRSVAIIGPPNVGKSTLANRLAGQDVSLVADSPGTTRDWVGEPIAVQGWPITLVDTAGLRATDDVVEAEGVSRALEQALRADVRLLVLDASGPGGQLERKVLDQLGLKAYDVVVYNKCDLPCRWPGIGREAGPTPTLEAVVSSLTGQGWSALAQGILIACGFSGLQEPKPLVFCAELQSRLSDLVLSLGSRQVHKAQAILEAL